MEMDNNDSHLFFHLQKRKECVELALQGLSQLQQFDTSVMSSGNEDGPNWNVEMTKVSRTDHFR